MVEKEKLPRYEIALYGGACALLAGSLALYLLNAPAVDQPEEAITIGLRYTLVPWALIFAAFFKGRQVEIKRKVFCVFNFSLVYTFCTVCPLLLVNMYVGAHEPVVVAGPVVEKKPGIGAGKASLIIRTPEGEISLRMPREGWQNVTAGESVSLSVRRGSLGLLYAMKQPVIRVFDNL